MRVYFEKPRTTVGWKGLINDPDLDGSFRHRQGPAARAQRAAAINNLGLPAGCEFLDMTTPQYIADLVTWARDRRAHHRKPDPSRAGLGPLLPGRLQERHRRQCPHRRRRREVGHPAASFPGGHQGRPLGHRLDHRQRRLPHHPARRQPAELRRRQASRPPAPNWSSAGVAPRLMIDASHANSSRSPRTSRWSSPTSPHRSPTATSASSAS